eukprot:GEMP01077311.1.p1 GENE.GEMP01077311.1~~GEMP01077311.1.p1  ORF type:complete len:146 (+),score=20.88 GEMP01077311.1:99-536(+)
MLRVTSIARTVALPRGVRTFAMAQTRSRLQGAPSDPQPEIDVSKLLWVPVPTREGKTYYWNRVTGETQWHHPDQKEGVRDPPRMTSQSNKVWNTWKFSTPAKLKAIKYTLVSVISVTGFAIFGGLTIIGRFVHGGASEERIRYYL